VPSVFQTIQNKGFDIFFTYHTEAILSQDFGVAVEELDTTISTIEIPIRELVAGGGGVAHITQRLRRDLNAKGWQKVIFDVEKKVNDRTTQSQSHEVDHVKSFSSGTLVLEIEWNNKDPFFDRDLENFNRLHADSAISVGMIITRGATLQEGIEERILNFANAHGIQSFDDLIDFGVDPTRRQRQAVLNIVQRTGRPFAEIWAHLFVADKFGQATTHWAKLQARLARGVGNPCPIVGIGIPLSCVVD
jgi:hypothetical protein